MSRPTLALVLLLLAQPPVQASEPAPSVLVVERAPGGLSYTMGGVVLGPEALYQQVIDRLGPEPATRPLFILLAEDVSLDQAFELGSLFMNKGGLRKLRYFAFSRQAEVMQEFHLDWQRWKLSETGALDPKPW